MYAKIVKWKIKNFRNLGNVEINFTKSPIVTLVGENEAGKTSVVKTFSVLGCNADPNSQKDYIRDGTSAFGIQAELEDGTVISRVKKKDGSLNAYDITKNGNSIFSATKIDKGFGTPVEVEKVMGMMIEPETKELLQVRTYEDQLLFVLTKSSENYKVMYNALKVDNLTKAINNGNKEANEKRRIIQSCENGIDTLEDTLKSIRLVDITNAVKVRDGLHKLYSEVTKLEKVVSLINRISEIRNELGVLNGLSEASEISEVLAYKLGSLKSALETKDKWHREVEAMRDIDALSEIELGVIDKFQSLFENKNRQSESNNKLNNFNTLSELHEIDISVLDKLMRVSDLSSDIKENSLKYSSYSQLGEEITSKEIEETNKLLQVISKFEQMDDLSTEINNAKTESDKWYTLIKDSGAIVTDCPNCGETVVVDASIQ